MFGDEFPTYTKGVTLKYYILSKTKNPTSTNILLQVNRQS